MKTTRFLPFVCLIVLLISPAVTATVRDGDRIVARQGGRENQELVVRLENPRLWSPEDPYLYDLDLELGKGQDSIKSYFGMRKIDVAADAQGRRRLRLNGQFVFQVGPLDQGFWPDGLYTAPTDEALRYDVEVTRQLGFNMARKHVKIEPARWYYWCDKLGLLVWATIRRS